jgi:hypothetical protein
MLSIPYSCQISMKIEFSRQIFAKHSNIKFHEKPSSGSRVVPCIRAEGRTDMTKPTVAFRNFANAPKNTKECLKTAKRKKEECDIIHAVHILTVST